MLYRTLRIAQIEATLDRDFTSLSSIAIDDSYQSGQEVSYSAKWKFSNSSNWSAWLPIPDAISMANNLLQVNSATIQIAIKVSINDAIEYSINSISINSVMIDSDFIDIRDTTEFRYNIQLTKHLDRFKPYDNQDGMIELQYSMVDSILQMFGHPFIWFKVQTDKVNNTFKSIEELSVSDVKEVKVLVPDNDFKDNALVYSEWGVEYDESLELHLPVEEFERKFGPGVRPQALDYFIIPQLGRIYEVTSAHAKKEFMHTATYYTITAKKYKHRADIDRTNESKTIFDIDTIRDFHIDNLQELINSDTKTRQVGDIVTDSFDESIQALSEHMYFDLRMHDWLRDWVNRSLIHNIANLCNGNMKFSVSQYNVSQVNVDEQAIVYRNKWLPDDSYRTIQFWFNVVEANSFTLLKSDKFVVRIKKNSESISLITAWDVEGENQQLTSMTIETSRWYNIVCKINLETRTVEIRLARLGNSEAWGKPLLSDIVEQTSTIDLDYNLTGFGQTLLMGGNYWLTNIRIYNKMLSDVQIIQNAVMPQGHTESSIIIDNAAGWQQ